MPTLPPVPPAERSPYGPDGAPKTSTDVSHRVRQAAERHERDLVDTATALPRVDAVDLWPAGPWLKLAGAVLAGYALGAVIHGGSRSSEPRPSPRPRSRTMPEPVASYRSSVAAEDRPSSIRFR